MGNFANLEIENADTTRKPTTSSISLNYSSTSLISRREFGHLHAQRQMASVFPRLSPSRLQGYNLARPKLRCLYLIRGTFHHSFPVCRLTIWP